MFYLFLIFEYSSSKNKARATNSISSSIQHSFKYTFLLPVINLPLAEDILIQLSMHLWAPTDYGMLYQANCRRHSTNALLLCATLSNGETMRTVQQQQTGSAIESTLGKLNVVTLLTH